MEEKLAKLLQESDRIFITSHISPDPDSVASTILLNSTLKLNFPNKQVWAVLEDEPVSLDFLKGYSELKFGPVLSETESFNPDLFILLDGNNYERCSRHDGGQIRQLLQANNVKTVIIDHHEPAGQDKAELYINNASAATAQDVYGLIKKLGLKMPDGAAETAMAGFYADTGGFVYVKAGAQKSIFGFAEELVSAGADIEAVKNRLESYTEDDMKALSELSGNLSHHGNYSYSFLRDEFLQDWAKKDLDSLSLQRPTNTFMNNFIRNIDKRRWGFIVYKNTKQGDNIYSVSLRSQGGQPDVSLIAAELGGGGHKAAAGAKFEAKDLKEALAKVQSIADRLG